MREIECDALLASPGVSLPQKPLPSPETPDFQAENSA